jgi:hypothetical protein
MPNCEPATPRTLCGPEPETDWNVDWRRIGLQTPAWRDFSRPRVACNSSKTKRKGGGQKNSAAAGLLTKNHQKVLQNVIFEVMSEVQKDSEDISAEIGILKN